MSSVSDMACINIICDAHGVVQFQTLPLATDDWASSDGAASHIGKPLIKTYWFDHLDCDHRDLIQVLRKAGAGSSERARVWMRVDEHQLVRAELTAVPLTDASGQTRNVLVRTEPSAGIKRKRDLGDPITKRLGGTEASGTDLLRLPLGVPMMRLELPSATILGVNETCADLLRRPAEQIANLPLTELVLEAERRALIEKLATGVASDTARIIDVHLTISADRSIPARLTLATDPSNAEAAIVTIRDLTTEQALQDVLHRTETTAATLTRNTERLKVLEGFFDRSPIGLALIDRGQILRSNRAFDTRPESEIRSDLQAVVRGDSPPFAITYRTEEQDGAPIALISGKNGHKSDSNGALTKALAANPRLVVAELSKEETLSLRAGTHPLLAGSSTELGQVFTPDALDDLRSAILVARTGKDLEPLDLRLTDGGFARVSLAAQADGTVLLLLEDETALRQEMERLGNQLQQQTDALAELSAKASAIDPAQFSSALAAASERDAQLTALVTALGAGAFTWDLDSGQVTADARAIELLGTEQMPTTINQLLAGATRDERRAFEQRYFDAVSSDRTLSVDLHVGENHRPLRLIGHVLMDEKSDTSDPRALYGVVIDQEAAEGGSARLNDLQHQLALRTAELNAILESSGDAIRILSGGTLRHNEAAGEMFRDNINAFLSEADDTTLPADDTIQSTRTPIVVNGESFGVVSVSRDQSDALGLQRREAQISAILANTGVAIAILDDQRRFSEVNPALCSLIGYSQSQLVGKPLANFVHVEDQPTLSGEFEAVESNELQSVTSDVRLLRRDRDSQWVHLTVTRPRGEAKPTTIVLAQDIAELRELRVARDRLAREVQESRERYERIAATVQDAVLSLTPDGQLLEANSVARTLFALDGKTSLSHLQFIAPESNTPLRDPLPWRRPAIERPSVMELRVSRPNGESFTGRFTLRTDEHGHVTLNVADVSRLHALQEELQKAYARIVESHTLLQSRTRQLEGNFVSAVQQLGASIAASYGSAKALRNDARLPKPLSQLASRVVDAFRVHRRLVQYFTASASASRSASAEDRVDVHALANDAVQALAERYNIAGRLELELEAAQHHSRLDGALVRHAFWSIFAHAVSQAGKSSSARVTSKSLQTTRGDGKLRMDVQWPSTRAGTAELNLAQALIESCGGTFELVTDTDNTLLTIEFSLDAESDAAGAAANAPRKHVLLVEDHESTARVLKRQLERLGCVVSHAGDLAAARTILDDRSDVDLLICDLSLPDEDSNGRLTALLRKIDLPAIALRSYGGVEPPEDLVAMGFVDHIDKPVDLNALSAAIARFATPQGE